MSKKLIAVASAAALALTALVGIAPANAAITVTYKIANVAGTDATANTYATSALATAGSAAISVPANNSIEYTTTATRSTAMKVTVTTAVGDAVTATSNGAKSIDAVTDATNKYTSANGSTTFAKTATTTSVEFYVFATSTSNASLAVSLAGNTETVWFKASAGPAYKLSVTLPSVVGTVAPTSNNVFASVVDVFGNNVSSGSGLTAAATSGATLTTLTWDSTDKRYEAKLHNATAGQFGVSASITDPEDVTGLGAEVISFFGTVNSQDAAAQVVTLTAQVAALTADYNSLAAKWNKRVASKTAPKKAVTLK